MVISLLTLAMAMEIQPLAALLVFRETYVHQEPPKESLSTTEVYIYNDIANDTIVVNCGISGQRLLGYTERSAWRFQRSISGGETKWSCGFRWGTKVKEFDVWAYHGLSDAVPIRPCTHTPCMWIVRQKGFYRNSGHGHGDPSLQHEWPWVL